MPVSRFSGPGSTPSRRKFWDNVSDAVTSLRKLEGKNVSVSEHDGYGSIIDVVPQRAKNQNGGACCDTSLPTLVCDTISASSGSCGYAAFDGSGRKFLTKTTVASLNASYDASAGCPPATSTSSWSSTTTNTLDPTSGCSESCECSGSGSFTVHFYTGSCVLGTDSGSTTANSCGNWGNCTSGGYDTISGCLVTGSSRPEAHGCFNCGGTTVIDSATSQTTTYACDPSGIQFFHGTVTVTLSNETAINDCDDVSLPSYSGDFSPCSTTVSSRNQTDSGCSISRSHYKFTWDGPLAETCKLCWIIRTFDPESNPIDDEYICETVSAGATESSIHEVLEPGSNGTREIVFPVGACCTDGICSITDAATCTGTYHGDSCSDNPCSPDPCL